MKAHQSSTPHHQHLVGKYPSKHIVARVGDVVYVGEGGGDGDFPIPVVWEAET